jgi:hypothetical protein
VPTAEARRRPCEAVGLPTYADGHMGGADEIYADGSTPTVAVGVGLCRRFS